MSELDGIVTPAAIVDLDVVERNLDRMQAYASEHGLALRPHVKTHKNAWLAAEQVRRGARGITVATTVETELLGAAASEVLIAYPPLGSRAIAAVASAASRPTLVALDSVPALDELRAAARSAGVSVGVLVELDVGMRRCGVQSPADALSIARACDGEHVVYRGVMFYPGHVREPVNEQDRVLAELSAALDRFRAELSQAGFAPAIVSGGSTPTAFRSHELAGLTEIRPGTYIFNDRTTEAIGACTRAEIAYTVLATVVSTAVPGQAVVDTGSKALSSDIMRAPGREGFGELLDRPEVFVTRMSEEHGVLDLSRSDWRPRVGERVRIVPNHVCVSVNLQTTIYGLRDASVVHEWTPDARGWRTGKALQTKTAGRP